VDDRGIDASGLWAFIGVSHGSAPHLTVAIGPSVARSIAKAPDPKDVSHGCEVQLPAASDALSV
jgi:hypothetical protein